MSINKVILVGRLGRDPETRYMTNNEPVCNFSIATDESWKDASGQRQQRTEWHNIVMYRRLAEIAQQYLKKGQLVYLEGRIQSRKYQSKDGIERTAYDIICSEMRMLGSRSDNEGYNSSSSGYSPFPNDVAGEPADTLPPIDKTPSPPKKPASDNIPEPLDDLDSDIPF